MSYIIEFCDLYAKVGLATRGEQSCKLGGVRPHYSIVQWRIDANNMWHP